MLSYCQQTLLYFFNHNVYQNIFIHMKYEEKTKKIEQN